MINMTTMNLYRLDYSYKEHVSRMYSIANCTLKCYHIYQMVDQQRHLQTYRAFNTQLNREVLAKIYDLSSLQFEPDENRRKYYETIYYREYTTMRSLMPHCRQILPYYDCFQNQFFIIIFVEDCKGNTLLKEIEAEQKYPNEVHDKQLWEFQYSQQHTQACHQESLVLRDLKPEDIHYKDGYYMIADCSLCKELQLNLMAEERSQIGIFTTIAPEIFQKKKEYGYKSDIWSLGVILWQMVFKKVPYTSLSIGAFIDSLKKEEIFVIQRLKYNEYTASSDMTLLLKEMLIPQIQNRICWIELIKRLGSFTSKSNYIEFRIDFDLKNPSKKIISLENQGMAKRNHGSKNKQMQKDHFFSSEDYKIVKTNPQQQNKSLAKILELENEFVGYCHLHLEYLKSEFINAKIILPIISQPVAELQNNYLLVYLLIARCQANILEISRRKSQNGQQNQQLITLIKMATPLYTQIQKLKIGTLKNLKVLQQEKSTFSKFLEEKKMKNLKQKFVNNFDPNKQIKREQINVTVSLIDEITQTKNQPKNQRESETCKYLLNYGPICDITLQNLRDKTFLQYVYEIINEKNLSRSSFY